MAYPSVDAAYGFKAINELNGLPYAGATRQIPIARSYGTSIFMVIWFSLRLTEL